MDTLFLSYALLGLTALALALAAGWIERVLWISEPLLVTGVGILVGPAVLDLIDPERWGGQERLLEELARLTLAISLMGVALRLPDEWIRRRWRPLLVLLGVGLPAMWLVTSACGWLLLGLPLLQALLLGAVLAPTDPVAASTIVTGSFAEENIQADARHLVSAESGANDGLAFLLVMLPMLLLEHPPGEAVGRWLLVVLCGKVLGAVAGGALAGFGVAKLLERAYRGEHASRGSLLAVTVALSLALLGLAKLVHVDGILAVFSAGLAFNWVIRSEEGHEEARHERIQQTVKRFFDLPVFLLFGMLLPWTEWSGLGWSGVLFCAAVLLLRRIPVLLLLRRALPPLRTRRDALFVGWFGPIAVAAMVYASWAELREGTRELWVVASLVIFASIVVHGASSTPLTRWYGRARAAREPSTPS